MAHGETKDDRARGQVEMTEETFLKDIYLFMKKRDTPIERIPHLGFKQIDLFVMYKTVKELGGYHQVTAQQLWKQVYNTLGGNPRSTSAATCTRRHYEKLLLPYECHVKGGEFMTIFSQRQSKQFHYNNLSKEDDCPRPAKRRPLLLPLSQNPHSFLPDSRVRIIPLPVTQYPPFYHPSHPVLPPYVPISPSLLNPHGPQIPQPQVFYHYPSPQSSTEEATEPLEHLRYLAEQYKSSSGLAEPLNLSVRDPESSSHPASSFTPRPASKNPKFLNQPSPLYPSKGVAKDEGCDTQEKDAAPRKYSSVPSHSHPLRASERYVIDLTSTSTTSSCSPTPVSAQTLRTDSTSPTSLLCNRKSNSTMTHICISPKRDFTDWPEEEKEENPRLSPRVLSLSHTLPSSPGNNGGKMEIQIPLSVLQKWFSLCGTSNNRHGTFQLPIPTQEVDTRDRSISNSDMSPTRSNLTNMIFHSHAQDQDSSAIEDLSPRQRNVPSPTPTTLTTSDRHSTLLHRFPSCKPLRSGSFFNDVSSQTAYPLDEHDTSKPYYPKPTNGWDLYNRGCQAHPIKLKMHSSPLTLGQDIVGPKSPAYSQDTSQGKVERHGMGPSAALMVNSASPSVGYLTSEEVMKLKRIIYSSS